MPALKVSCETRVIITVELDESTETDDATRERFHSGWHTFLAGYDARTMHSGAGLYVESVLPEHSRAILKWLDNWK